MLFLFLFFGNCKNKEYSPFYFVLFPYLKNGWNRPEKVKNIQINYRWDQLLIEIQWSNSVDPDTNQSVPYYFLYIYYEYPEHEQYYDKKYLLDITTENRYLFPIPRFTGVLYLIITAYDLGAESEISDIIQISIP